MGGLAFVMSSYPDGVRDGAALGFGSCEEDGKAVLGEHGVEMVAS